MVTKPSLIKGVFAYTKVASDIGLAEGWSEGQISEFNLTLLKRITEGVLPTRSRLTGLKQSEFADVVLHQVHPNDVNKFLELEGMEPRWRPTLLPVDGVARNTDISSPPDTWVIKSQKRAIEIIERQRRRDLYPSQVNISDEICKEFRAEGVTGAGGKPLSGGTIKRHGLKGISSAQGKQLSTQTGRGKRGK